MKVHLRKLILLSISLFSLSLTIQASDPTKTVSGHKIGQALGQSGSGDTDFLIECPAGSYVTKIDGFFFEGPYGNSIRNIKIYCNNQLPQVTQQISAESNFNLSSDSFNQGAEAIRVFDPPTISGISGIQLRKFDQNSSRSNTVADFADPILFNAPSKIKKASIGYFWSTMKYNYYSYCPAGKKISGFWGTKLEGQTNINYPILITIGIICND